MRLSARPLVQPSRPEATPAEGARAFGSAKVDRLTDAMGLQGVIQDASRAATLAGRGRHLAKVSAIAAGDTLEIGRMVVQASRATREVAKKASPYAARHINRLAPRVLRTAGKALHLVGKWGPIISLPFAGYDVAKAVKEPDPAAKRAAWANASLTVGGTALGIAGVMAASGPYGAPMLAASAAIGTLQLADTYLYQGKVMQWLGDTTARVLQR